MPFIEGLIIPFKSFPYTVKDVESVERMFASFPVPRVFKTHLTYEMVPKGHDDATKPRYIYVMRNGKDAFVSHYHHHRNMPYAQEIPSWDEAFGIFMKGEGKYQKLYCKCHVISCHFMLFHVMSMYLPGNVHSDANWRHCK